jgi:hypothetical protein
MSIIVGRAQISIYQVGFWCYTCSANEGIRYVGSKDDFGEGRHGERKGALGGLPGGF